MPKFIIQWDAGFGPSYETVDVENFDAAMREAYDIWLEESEGQAYYRAEEWTKEKAEDLDLDE